MNTTLEVQNTDQTTASAFFDDISDTLYDLYARWVNECEFENLDDYRKALVPLATKHGVTIVKMTKRPFGFVFTTEIGTYKATAKRGITTYNRIK